MPLEILIESQIWKYTPAVDQESQLHHHPKEWNDSNADTHFLWAQGDSHIVSKGDEMTAMQIRTPCKPRVTVTLSVKRVRWQPCRYTQPASPEWQSHCQQRGWGDSHADTHELQAQSDSHIVSKEGEMTAMQIHTHCKPIVAGTPSTMEIAW